MQTRDFWTRLETYPPILLRLLARVRWGRPLESTEIAERSGLSVALIESISHQTDWRGIDLPTARAFMVGCNIDLTDAADYHRITTYLKVTPKTPRSRFRYLRKSERWETYFLPLLDRCAKHLKQRRN